MMTADEEAVLYRGLRSSVNTQHLRRNSNPVSSVWNTNMLNANFSNLVSPNDYSILREYA